MNQTKNPDNRITVEDVLLIFKPLPFSERGIITILFLIGVFLTPITLLGITWFFMRSYYRHMKPRGMEPNLWPLLPVTALSMAIGGVVIWVVLYLMLRLFVLSLGDYLNFFGYWVIFYFIIMLAWSFGVLAYFFKWRINETNAIRRETEHGSARLAYPEEYLDLAQVQGIYIGAKQLAWKKKGHILTFAGTQSGKFVNLIAHNLLGFREYSGSWFIIDVKGQALAVTRKFQQSIGRIAIELNPWCLFGKSVATFNPLDLLNPKDPESMIDDSAILAQMIVPDIAGDKDPYWRNRARSWITVMIVHIMTSETEKTLTTVWKWLRLSEKDFAKLIVEMTTSTNDLVKATGNEIYSVKDSEKAYSSILSTAQDATDFLKSPALQRSLKSSNFNISDLTKGMVTLYVVIPADKIDTYAAWLRLVVTTSMLSVVRNPGKRVTFILDEFANLGKMDIVKTYMGLAAGYNLTLWPIFQDISQIKDVYGKGWKNFMANAAVKQYFGISNDLTAEYISKSIGTGTVMSRGDVKFSYETMEEGGIYVKEHFGENKTHARAVLTPDEVKRNSANFMLIQVEQRHTLSFRKYPYYNEPELIGRADPDPYYTPDL